MAASIEHRPWLLPSSQNQENSIPVSWPPPETKPTSLSSDLSDLSHRSILDLMMPPSRLYSHPSPPPAALPPPGHFPAEPQRYSQQTLEIDREDYASRKDSSSSAAASVTLDLLGCLQPLASSCDSTIELDSGSPPPCGWEKCLDLKTGNIYYVNKSNGVSSSDLGKAFLKSKVDRNWSSSPPTSELTAEISRDPKVPSSPLALGFSSNIRKTSTTESGVLDLNLNLHLGLRTSSTKAFPNEISCLKSFHSPTFGASIASSRPVKVSTSTTSSTSSAASPAESASHSQDTNIRSFKIQDLFKSSEDKAIPFQASMEGGKAKHDQSANRRRSPSVLRAGERNGVGFERVEAPIADEAMITVGCGNCLMFVMLSRSNSKCPRCGTCLLLDSQPGNAKRQKLGFSF